MTPQWRQIPTALLAACVSRDSSILFTVSSAGELARFINRIAAAYANADFTARRTAQSR
jgi:hypothetical protein